MTLAERVGHHLAVASQPTWVALHACMDEVCRDAAAFPTPAPPLRAFMRAMSQVGANDYLAIAALDETRSVTGWCDVARLALPTARHVGAISLGVRPQFRRQGIGRDLLATCVRGAFMARDFERLEVMLFADNAIARPLYESIGFVQEGLARQARVVQGVARDVVLMGLLRSEWLASPATQHMLSQIASTSLPVADPVKRGWLARWFG
jgi:RimJ/RimL family protein N-acetyltransferase